MRYTVSLVLIMFLAAPLSMSLAVSSIPLTSFQHNRPLTQVAQEGKLSLEKQMALLAPISRNVSTAAQEPKKIQKPLQPYDKELKVRAGETIAGVLQSHGIQGAQAHDIVKALSKYFDPRKVRAGQTFSIHMIPNETDSYDFASMAMNLGPTKDVVINRVNNKITSKLLEKKTTTQTFAASTNIENSIYGSASKAGIPAGITAEMIRVYSWNVDFQRDIRRGDKLEILYEAEVTEDGKIVKYGDLLYANLGVGGKDTPMFRHEKKDGHVDYFDEKGISIRKTLMRTPIDGARLSSGFGMRKHPVLGYNKMHKGVDFAARTGTPIYAAGNGKITYKGRKGGYGNYISIRHNGQLSTAYAHMSKFAKSMKVGKYVKQGQVIGYVGSTGRSTGPHLHYEVIKNGVQVNPRSIKLPIGEKLAGAELKRFKANMKNANSLHASLSSQNKVVKLAQRQTKEKTPNLN